MLRDTLIATASSLLVVVAFLWSDAHPYRRGIAPEEPSRAVLDRRIPGEVHIKGSFREAIDQLVARGCPIDVHASRDWPYGDHQNAIDLLLRDATVEQWVDAVTFQIGRWQATSWVGMDGRISVADVRGLKPPATTCVYDVRDLIDAGVRFEAIFPRRAIKSWPEEMEPIDPRAEAWSKLDDAVSSCCRPYSWARSSGSSFGHEFGSIGERDNRAIISQTPQTHRRIEVMLAALREQNR